MIERAGGVVKYRLTNAHSDRIFFFRRDDDSWDSGFLLGFCFFCSPKYSAVQYGARERSPAVADAGAALVDVAINEVHRPWERDPARRYCVGAVRLEGDGRLLAGVGAVEQALLRPAPAPVYLLLNGEAMPVENQTAQPFENQTIGHHQGRLCTITI